MDTRKLDLNLLVALEALLAECNVTRAAVRLHISQSALSAQLARLRQLFDDPLLIPGRRGMTPSARALALREPLREALEAVRGVVNEQLPFDAGTADMTVAVAATDYAQHVVALPWLHALMRAAPGIRVALHPLDAHALESQMEGGTIDVALVMPATAPPRLRARTLLHERYVCAVRHDHPMASEPASLDQFLRWQHVIVSPRGGGFFGPMDSALAELGQQRAVRVSCSNFVVALDLVAGSDLVALLPERLVEMRGERVRVLPPPIAIEGFEIAMVWHERNHANAAQRWLREQLVAACAAEKE
ncbi:MAG TPA: LysR family transcriptional regulator [Albitalea sp.]|nr:LysR family transcriptional regulator [Albitalea sp.]